jgi:hypothetical protein
MPYLNFITILILIKVWVDLNLTIGISWSNQKTFYILDGILLNSLEYFIFFIWYIESWPKYSYGQIRIKAHFHRDKIVSVLTLLWRFYIKCRAHTFSTIHSNELRGFPIFHMFTNHLSIIESIFNWVSPNLLETI